MIQVNEDNFIVHAMNSYDNPSCHDVSEFEEDLKRFQYLRKLFGRYKQFGELKERLVLNHLIVLYNVFGHQTTDMLYFKLEGFHDCLKPFIDYLNYTNKYIRYDDKIILSETIQSDLLIENKLRKI